MGSPFICLDPKAKLRWLEIGYETANGFFPRARKTPSPSGIIGVVVIGKVVL